MSTVIEVKDATLLEVNAILAALKRHPGVLEALAAKLKKAAPLSGRGARRRGLLLAGEMTDEMSLCIFLNNTFHNPRRGAVQTTAEEVIRGRMLRQPRRRGMLHLPNETLHGLRGYLHSEAYLDLRHALEEGKSSSSSGSDSSDSELTDGSSSAGGAADGMKPEDAFHLSKPTANASDDSSLHSYETLSSDSNYSDADGDAMGAAFRSRHSKARAAEFFDEDAAFLEPQAIAFVKPSKTWVARGKPKNVEWDEDADDEDDEGEEAKDERRREAEKKSGLDSDASGSSSDSDGALFLSASNRRDRDQLLEADDVLPEYVELRPDVLLALPQPSRDDSALAALGMYASHPAFDEALMRERQMRVDEECQALATWLVEHTATISPEAVMAMVYSLHDADVTDVQLLAESLQRDLFFLSRGHRVDEADAEEVVHAMAAAGLIDVDEEVEEDRRSKEIAAKQAAMDAECGVMADWIVTHTSDISPEAILQMVYTLHAANMPTLAHLAQRVSDDVRALDRLGFDECNVDEVLNALDAQGLVQLYEDAEGIQSDDAASQGSREAREARRAEAQSRERQRARPESNSSVLSKADIMFDERGGSGGGGGGDSDDDW